MIITVMVSVACLLVGMVLGQLLCIVHREK